MTSSQAAAPAAATGEVLYGDYNGHMRPLKLMYFSLDSRCLVADHPESVQEEVESHFCPHCNWLCTALEAPLHSNRCVHCFECPCCGCVLAPAPTTLEPSSRPADGDSLYCLRCLYCQWTSEELGLVAADPASLAEAVAEQERKGVLHENIVTGLVQAVKQREAEALGAARSRKSGSGRARTGSGMVAEDAAALFSGAPGSTTGPWKVGDLEEAISQRNQVVVAASRSVGTPPPAANTAVATTVDQATAAAAAATDASWSLEHDTDTPDSALWTLTSGHETAGVAERVGSGLTAPDAGGGGGSLRRVRLRTRLGKRCRKDLAAGRTGILIKATFNPLEADSSGAKKGKWFKKDCSAALLVPRITVASLPPFPSFFGPSMPQEREGRTTPAAAEAAAAGGPSLTLRLANPQVTLLRVRFAEDNISTADDGASAWKPTEGVLEKADDGTAADEETAGLGAARKGKCVAVTVRPKGWRDDNWVRLEGKEDEVLWQPGDRYRLPESVARVLDGDGTSGGVADGGDGGDEGGGSGGALSSVLHQQGDVAWVRLSLDRESVERVASAVEAVGASSAVVLTVRLALVMREGEEEEGGAGGGDVRMPIAIRFPLPRSRC